MRKVNQHNKTIHTNKTRHCPRVPKYISLPNCGKVEVFHINEGGTPIFTPQFLRLWSLLFDVGEASPPPVTGSITTFILPRQSTSKLVGTPFVTGGNARLLSFKNLNGLINMDAPVTNEGFELDIYSEDLDYKFSWKTRDNIKEKDFTIGFYRSNGFVYDTDNVLSLISSYQGPTLFNKTEGSFTCPGLSLFYVVINRDVTVDLEVSIIIPKKKTVPLVTEDRPYVKYINIYAECGEVEGCDKVKKCSKFKVPVYKIIRRGKNETIIEDKQPTKIFRSASDEINRYLRENTLSLNLIPDDIPNEILNATSTSTKITLLNVKTRENAIGGSVSLNTDDRTTYQTNVYLGMHQGIKLDPPEGQVPKITFRITTSVAFYGSSPYKVAVQYLTASRWPTHNKLDPSTGNNDGEAWIAGTLSAGTQEINQSFILQEDAKDFGITIYYYDATRELRSLLSTTRFNEITIEYIRKPGSQ